MTFKYKLYPLYHLYSIMRWILETQRPDTAVSTVVEDVFPNVPEPCTVLQSMDR